MFGLPIGLIIKIGIVLAIIAAVVGLYEADNHWCNAACKNQVKRADTAEKAFKDAVAEAEATESHLKKENELITAKYAEASKEINELAKVHFATLQEKIKNDKELASVKLSLNAVRLFNESKDSGNTNGQGPSSTKPSDDGKASTPATLADLISVVASNDQQHLRCIQQVGLWQNFWQDYVSNVAVADGTP